tara:strand:+ start:3115 stop:3786 length:672 start_codon:yes stop_codon:yes gene_type:complete
MSKLENNYELIANEIKSIHENIIDLSKDNKKITDNYMGCQVLFSKLIYKPKYLLIGYNPGSGYYKYHKNIVESFKQMSDLEYYLNKHKLGEQTKTLFLSAGKECELKKSTVKINFYPWATDDIISFEKLMKAIPSELKRKIYENARIWNRKLIEIINPEIIICEGFKAFYEVEVLFQKKYNFSKEENSIFFKNENGLKIFGYKRNQGSILNKDELSYKLKEIS